MSAARAAGPRPADSPLLPEPLGAEARATAREIMLRLADRDAVSEAATTVRNEASRPIWDDGVSMYGGATGLALAFSHAARVLDRAADDWILYAGRWLRQAVACTRQAPVTSAGIADGTAGLALALSDLASHDRRYAKSLHTLHGQMREQVGEMSRRPAGSLSFRVYDTISGAAGTLGSLSSVSPADPVMGPCVRELSEQLIGLCELDHDKDRWAPWCIPPENQPPRDLGKYPHGYVDLGLAHGIPGPLAALSRAWSGGHRPRGSREAIHRLATQLVSVVQTNSSGLFWPRVMPFDESGAVTPHMSSIGGPTYCYGSPGICSALLDAADVLADDSVRDVAVKGFEATLRRVLGGGAAPVYPGLCHGLAGLVLVCRKFAHRTDSDPARAALPVLTEELLGRCDPRSPFVIRDYLAPVAAPEPGDAPQGTWVDNPGLLEGAAGVALALMSAPSAAPPGWARALLVD
ncbi:lanthionine synthetase C family protein [Actinomadura rugatobispora]|uniref:Lanthionine synthetase C family protein n=1 Tax=Actinomadura rugatobispora TaxID=1994 RepID=A0ABW0ZN81_9ACTN|nr:lanthionine synthetase C family protein [Actinomadura rugatobispora]